MVLVYLSLVGMLFEASFFVRLGFPAFRYTDPQHFAFAILNHPVLVTIVAVVVLSLSTNAYLAANVVVKVYGEGDRADGDHQKTSTGKTDGKTDEGKAISGGRGVRAVGLWLLGLPGRAVMLFLIVDNAVMFFSALPLVAAVNAAGLNYASLTNGNADFRRLGLDRFFAFGFCAADVGASKPHTAMFEQALAKAGVAPHEAVHVGDHAVDDIQGAQAAGMATVWVNLTGSDANPAATATVTSLAQIPATITALTP